MSKKVKYEVAAHPSPNEGKLFFKRNGIEGEVPPEVCKQGEKAVQDYVEKEIDRIQAKREKFKKFGEQLNVIISVRHRGTLLKGKIIAASSRFVAVRLDQPKKYSGTKTMNYGFASAMAGHRVFEKGDEPKLTENAIESGQQLLIWIYDEKKFPEDNKEVIDLAGALNRR